MRFEFHRHKHPAGAAWRVLAIAAAVIGLGSVAHATDYSESTIGDFSNDNLAPTAVTFTVGSNIISGSTFQDNDYMTFTIPVGEVLSGIEVLDATQAPDRTFFGIASGDKVVVDPSFSSAAGLIGWTLFNDSMNNTDILPDLGKAAPPNFDSVPGATGFTAPLGAGTYSTWILDGDNAANYRLDFQVAGVPEPSTWAMMLGGFGLAGWALRRRSRQGFVAA
jgi:hypothetical protein